MSDAQITLQPVVKFKDLIIEAFETKDKVLVTNKLKEYALSVGYDLDKMYENGPPVVDINMYTFEIMVSLISTAVYCRKLGEIQTGTMPMWEDYNTKVVRFFRACGMSNSSQDYNNFMIYFTSPLVPRIPVDLTLKEKVLKMIEDNNAPPKPVDETITVYTPEYYESQEINYEIKMLKDNLLNQAGGIKSLEEYVHLVSGSNAIVGQECVDWLKECGFEGAHTYFNEGSMMLEVRLA